MGEQRERTISGALGVAQALVEVASSDGMVRELGEVGPGVLAVERLERLHRQPVQPNAAGSGEPIVEGVPNEDVREAQATGRTGNVGDDARGHRLVEQVEQRVLRHTPDAGKRVEGELAAHHGREH